MEVKYVQKRRNKNPLKGHLNDCPLGSWDTDERC